MKAIGLIGLGHMGMPMMNNLLKAGFTVQVHDIMPQAVEAAVKLGATAADSVAELTHSSDVVITMVQTAEQVVDLCSRPDGIFVNAKAGLLYIDCSSIDIMTSKHLHEEADKMRISMLDAPVSGGVSGAEAGTLTLMVGGREEDVARAQPIFKALGKNIIHAGNAGMGQAAKICNNLLLGITMLGVCEAFTLAESLGLDKKKFFEISSHASGQCWSMTSYCPVPGIIDNVPANRDYAPGFMAKMMLKDLRLGQHAAEAVNAVIPLGSVATELYELYVNQGFGEKDFSGIINLIAGKE